MKKRARAHGRRAILVGAAPLPAGWLKRELKRIKLSPLDLLIGVDGGVEACLGARARPDFAVGDWDSLKSRKSLAGVPHVTLPRDKDRSDLFFGIEAARYAGATELVVLGASGGRADHHLAALYDLAQGASLKNLGFARVTAEGVDDSFHWVSPAQGTWRIRLKPGSSLSLFAAMGSAQMVKISGLRFSGVLKKIEPSSHGLSNLARKPEVSVSSARGVVLLVIPKV